MEKWRPFSLSPLMGFRLQLISAEAAETRAFFNLLTSRTERCCWCKKRQFLGSSPQLCPVALTGRRPTRLGEKFCLQEARRKGWGNQVRDVSLTIALPSEISVSSLSHLNLKEQAHNTWFFVTWRSTGRQYCVLAKVEVTSITSLVGNRLKLLDGRVDTVG